jgi:hypothetical protein
MTLARLLAAALVLCSLSVFAQGQQSQSSHPSTSPRSSNCAFGCAAPGNILGDQRFFFALSYHSAATPSEPWRIFPNSPATLVSGQTSPDQVPSDQFKTDLRARQFNRLVLDSQDTMCYAIRSYVVARDSKASDSTHPVSYSTCQKASRYQLKTTEMRSVTVDR